MNIQPDYLSKAIAEFINGEPRNLNYFINKLSSSDICSGENELIIDEMLRIKDNIPLSAAELLTKLLTDTRPWHVYSSKVAKKAIHFLVALATRYDEIAEHFLSHICAIICSSSSYSDVDSETNLTEVTFDSLREFFTSMPHFENSFLKYLRQSFPVWGRSTSHLFSDISNILKLCSDSPRILTINAAEIIYSACFDLLANVELRVQAKSDAIDTFPADLTSPFDPKIFGENFEIISKSLTEKSDKRSTLFWLYCVSLLKTFPTRDRGLMRKDERSQERSLICAVFHRLRDTFVQNILPVQSSFGAFPLLLVFMSTLRPNLGVDLLENLWNFVKKTQQIEEVKIDCIRFLADYLALCKYCIEDVVIELLHDLAAWCVQYTYHRKGRPISHSFEFMKRSHKLFYTIFESIVYVVTFRQAKLLGSSVYRGRCTEIPLIQIISSPFKPLDAVEPNLRANFLAVSLAYKMNWTAVMPPNDYSTQVGSDPKPSFSCPLKHALRMIPIANHLDLFNDFILAKRVQTRICENGNGVSSSSEESQPPAKRPKNSDPRYFNFQALADLK